jgi:hypothetical protein
MHALYSNNMCFFLVMHLADLNLTLGMDYVLIGKLVIPY